MKRATSICSLSLALLWMTSLPSLSAEKETISGQGFRAIQAAVPELERHKLNSADYQITVWRQPFSLIVLFYNAVDVAPGEVQLGCPGPRPCFSVELSKDDYRVIGSQFDR